MDRRKYVFLDYIFIFEPSLTWTSLPSFESDLADFFAAHELESEIMRTADGQVGKRVLLISRMEFAKGQPEDTSRKPAPKIPVKKDLDRVRKEY